MGSKGRMKKLLFFLSTLIPVSCPIGPSIPTEALLCITGKTRGTAKIEAVGGNEASAGFGKTFVLKESFGSLFFLRLFSVDLSFALLLH